MGTSCLAGCYCIMFGPTLGKAMYGCVLSPSAYIVLSGTVNAAQQQISCPISLRLISICSIAKQNVWYFSNRVLPCNYDW